MVTKYIMGAYWLHLDKDLSTSGNIVIIFIFIGTVLGSNWTCLYVSVNKLLRVDPGLAL